MTNPLTILLLGSGGREHALAWKLAQSPLCQRLLVAPGNPGTAEIASNFGDLNILDGRAVADFAVEQGVGLVIIGPEAPLAAGVADAVRAAGIPCFGPSAAAARLEASKSFTKAICEAADIPTAGWASFDQLEPALAHVRAGKIPIVVKADGLAAGKGVTVAMSLAEAEDALRTLFADPGASALIEEYMEGEEVSFFVIADGVDALPLIAAQDHKRVGDGDTGPNTGGMGAYAPARLFTAELQKETMDRIVRPTLKEMAARGTAFSGVLFVGLMLTDTGPRLIEYNVRFGDPECQVLMLLLDSDLVRLLLDAATGNLASASVRWKKGHAATVIIAAHGYPGIPKKGGSINGLAEAGATGATLFHAGTAIVDGQLVAAGGRVLAVTALDDSVRAAVQRCYAAVDKVSYADALYRRDIGWREMARESDG